MSSKRLWRAAGLCTRRMSIPKPPRRSCIHQHCSSSRTRAFRRTTGPARPSQAELQRHPPAHGARTAPSVSLTHTAPAHAPHLYLPQLLPYIATGHVTAPAAKASAAPFPRPAATGDVKPNTIPTLPSSWPATMACLRSKSTKGPLAYMSHGDKAQAHVISATPLPSPAAVSCPSTCPAAPTSATRLQRPKPSFTSRKPHLLYSLASAAYFMYSYGHSHPSA